MLKVWFQNLFRTYFVCEATHSVYYKIHNLKIRKRIQMHSCHRKISTLTGMCQNCRSQSWLKKEKYDKPRRWCKYNIKMHVILNILRNSYFKARCSHLILDSSGIISSSRREVGPTASTQLCRCYFELKSHQREQCCIRSDDAASPFINRQ
jgi:hypothetical protein